MSGQKPPGGAEPGKGAKSAPDSAGPEPHPLSTAAWLPRGTAAELAGVSERTLRRWIRAGRVTVTQIDGQELVAADDLPGVAPGGTDTAAAQLDAATRLLRQAHAQLEATHRLMLEFVGTTHRELVREVDQLRRDRRARDAEATADARKNLSLLRRVAETERDEHAQRRRDQLYEIGLGLLAEHLGVGEKKDGPAEAGPPKGSTPKDD